MMKATIQTQYLREMIDAITAVVTEFRLHVQEDGITMVAVDTQNVALVAVTLPKEVFLKYEAPPGVVTPTVLGIDAVKMKGILKDMPDAQVTLSAAGEGEYSLEWTPPGSDWFDSHQYWVKALETASIRKDPNLPTLAFDAMVEVPSNSLLTALTALSHHTDKVVLILHKEDNMFSVSGEADSIKVRIQGPAAPVQATVRSLYSLDYLLDMVKAVPCGTTIHLFFSTDRPLKLTYCIADGPGRVLFLQAPRIETE